MEFLPFAFDGAESFLDSPPGIDVIPDEMLLEIFQKLEAQDSVKKLFFRNVSLVSKRWYSVANAARASLCLQGHKAAKIVRIFSRFKGLTSLNLEFLFDCSEEVLAEVGRSCHMLKELHVSDSYKHTNGGFGLSAMACGCRMLEILSVTGYKGPDNALMAIGSHCTALRQLRLRSAPYLSDNVIINIARNCHKIEEFDVSFTDISDTALRAIGEGLPFLRKLDLKHCKFVTGEGIGHVAMGCRELQILHLGVVEVGDKGLASIGRYSKRLEELYLDYGWGKWGQLSRWAMAAVAKGCQQLKLLSLRGSKHVDDEVLQGLAKGCPSLTSLDLHACEQVGDIGLEAVIKGCKQLENLVLAGTAVGASAFTDTNKGLTCLKTLRVNGERITDTFIQAITKNCATLEELHLANCGNISDIGLESVLINCKSLKTLISKASPGISGTAFSGTYPSLETLALPSCGITNEGLAAIIENCSNLKHLSIPNSCQVAAESLVNAVRTSTHLKELNIVGCMQVSKEQVLRIVKSSRPSLKTMRVSRPDSPQDEYTLNKKHGGWTLPSWARVMPPTRTFPMSI